MTLDGESLPAGLTREIVAVLRVPEGRHLYGEPVSGGLVAASIELDETPGILSYTPVFPDTRPLTLSGDGHTLQIYDGDVVLRLPVAQNGRTMNKDEDGRWVTVSGRVRWQACDQESCGLPEEQRFEIRVPAGYTLMADMGPGAGKVPAMNGAAHMKTMVSRRACGN
ncbi:MAG: protein-disulfide reductase DsbD domain-containing protein [Actinomycetota bacterium]|nr:protein-disulfide reductase DsbD domain-containing protein [Actinomycetota bacterium]